MIRNILVCGSDSQGEFLPEVRWLFAILRRYGFITGVERGFSDWLVTREVDIHGFYVADGMPGDTDLVISLGGDGTLLRTATLVGDSGVPVMGINTGHLGYLAGFSFDEREAVEAALRGEFIVSPRMTLRVETDTMPEGFCSFALNEVSVAKGDTTSMVSIHAYVDGRFLADYQADGLVISTPTGSTAYNMSCGGPIVQPTVECMVLSPIAPHSLTLRPLVISASSELTLVVSSRGEECHVGVDGRTFAVPADGTRLAVKRAGRLINVAQPETYDFAEVLRRKLRWAEPPLRT